uniref:Uncharacterized protein n=1 Tax=Alexandrium andersonii TaxID=327968 RepID=A0A7S2B7M2_9DINO
MEEMAGHLWDEAAMLGAAIAATHEAALDVTPEELEEPQELAALAVHLRAEAPTFEPHVLGKIAEEAPRLQLSADAPAFVPVGPAPATKVASKAAAFPVASGEATVMKVSISSDTSTQSGDSDGEDSLVHKNDA